MRSFIQINSVPARAGLRLTAVALVLPVLLSLWGCDSSDSDASSGNIGIVTRIIGTAEIATADGRDALAEGRGLMEGDVIYTGADSIVLLDFKSGRVEAELQPESEFQVKSIAADEDRFALPTGQLWMRVNPRDNATGQVVLESPTAVAAVRGTKFYTFHMRDHHGRDVYGTCHCEGDVHYNTVETGYESHHEQDHMVMTIDGKTFLMTPEELSFLGETAHAHSMLENSPLGPNTIELEEEQMQALADLIDRKMAD